MFGKSTWQRRAVLLLYLVAVAIVTLQRLEMGRHGVYLIFREASIDFLEHRNLYELDNTMDYFRYSPTFALAFLPLALLPIWLGVLLWNLLNAFTLYAGLGRLLAPRHADAARLIVLGDLVRSMQSSQSNALVAALIVAAFIAYERDRPWRAAWAVAAGALIKIFPLGAGLFALVRRRPARSLGAIAAVLALLALMPAVTLGLPLLARQYHWWVLNERAEVFKPMYSVMDLVDAWTGYYWVRWPMQAAGLAGLLIPVALRRDCWPSPGWRLRLLASVLVFCVLFNHGAESPSYVIATAGIAIWWAATPRARLRDVALGLTLLLSTVGRSSIVPHDFRVDVLDASRAMVLPLLVAWIALQLELLRGQSGLEPDEPHAAPAQSLA